VVEDSAVARRALVRILESDPALRVVGEAADGAQAVAMVAQLRPDVVTMDVHMPVMDGLEATRRIMERSPTPIVVVSGTVRLSDVARSVEALQAGALTVLERPAGAARGDVDGHARVLVETVKVMAGVKIKPHRGEVWSVAANGSARPSVQGLRSDRPERVDVVGVAASTGGPAALVSILASLPRTLPVPVMVVQHIQSGFERGLVSMLDRLSPLRVRLAVHGQPAEPGEVLVAPSDAHLALTEAGLVMVERSAPIDGHRPSANVLFRSLARARGTRAMGVVLTGMGRDGTDGLVELHRAGGWVVAQDEASSVVFGMPQAAAASGAVDRVEPLERIADAIADATARGRARLA
jgi:two-component system chemotaxis response regulator CheB